MWRKNKIKKRIDYKKKIKEHSETSSKKVYLLKIWDLGGQESIVIEVWKSKLLNISGLFSVGAAGLNNNRQKNKAGYFIIRKQFLSESFKT